MTLVFIDLETTGLDPKRHDAWEFGAYVRGHLEPKLDGAWHWLVRPRLGVAESPALRVNRFYERGWHRFAYTDCEAWLMKQPDALYDVAEATAPARCTRFEVARDLATLLAGAQLVGIRPWFDAGFLDNFLRSHRQAPAWDDLIDLRSLALGGLAGMRAGYNRSVAWLAEGHAHVTAGLGQRCDLPDPELDQQELPALPVKSDDLFRRLGVTPPDPSERHTALGDAAWAMAVWDAVMGAPA